MSLLHGREIILQSAKWRVGNGQTIDICKDKWLESGELILDHPNLPCTKVAELMDESNLSWNIPKIMRYFRPETTIKIIQTPLKWSSGQDSIWWPLAKAGDYTVKTGYYEAKRAAVQIDLGPTASVGITKDIWNEIWKAKLPQKLKHFMWKTCHNILPVRENLCKRKVFQSSLCPIAIRKLKL